MAPIVVMTTVAIHAPIKSQVRHEMHQRSRPWRSLKQHTANRRAKSPRIHLRHQVTLLAFQPFALHIRELNILHVPMNS